MSCLMLSELPLSDQNAIELTWAAKLEARALALITALDAPTAPAGLPLDQSYLAGASILLPVTEQAA
jgi:hypothetical protein